MCKANYDFRYTHAKWFKECPHHLSRGNMNWIPENRAKVMNQGPNRTSNGYFESPLGVWNAFYESWMIQMEQHISPTIFVRFEDLLFRPTQTVTKICQCMGRNELLNSDGSINIYEDKSKPHGKSNDRESAMRTYSDPMYRYTGFLSEDIEYVEQHVNRTILEMFAYHDRLGNEGWCAQHHFGQREDDDGYPIMYWTEYWWCQPFRIWLWTVRGTMIILVLERWRITNWD